LRIRERVDLMWTIDDLLLPWRVDLPLDHETPSALMAHRQRRAFVCGGVADPSGRLAAALPASGGTWGGSHDLAHGHALQLQGNPLQLLDGIGALQLHQLPAVPAFDPADADIGDQEAHRVAVAQVGHEGGSLVIVLIPADIAGGHLALLLKALGKSLEGQHQIPDQSAVLLGKT